MPEYVIHLHRINRELDRSHELIREHCQHLNKLADDGCLIAAGPFEDGTGGLIIGRFDSELDAIRFANSDPFVLGGDCRAEVRAWHWSSPENGHLGALPPRPGSWPGFLDTLRLRATVRCFARETLSEQTVRTLIEAAITAPSEFNLQPWRPVICRTSDERNRLMQCCFNQPHVASVALAVICAVDPKEFYNDAPRAVDESIAAGRLAASQRDKQIDFIRSC